MTDSIDLTYGGRPLTLTKSASLVALRPRTGMRQMMNRAVAGAIGARGDLGAERLAGFDVLDTFAPPEETDRQLNRLRESVAVATGSHVFHTADDGVPFVPTGVIYIEFQEGSGAEARQAVLDQCRLQVVETRGADAMIARTTPDSPNPVKVAATLQRLAAVSVAEPELASPARIKAFVAPQDALLADQWHLRNVGFHRGRPDGFLAGADARVVAAWERSGSIGSPAVVLAMIDDGFDLDHPDFSGNGKVVHPWDFSRNSKDPSPDIGDAHGTACAGVALGRAGNGGIVGASPGSTLMPVRWGPDLSDGQVEAWFDYVTGRGAWVVSCSWGAAAKSFPLSTRIRKAITRCATAGRNGKGCVIVFAAGNSNHDINNPAGGTLDGFAIHPDVIAVAASNSRDQRSNYSNYGAEIALCAPSSGAGGWGVLTADATDLSTVTGAGVQRGYAAGDYYYDFGGTSSACPLVAGVCALVLAANPGLDARAVRDVLQSTARKIGDAAGYEDGHSRYFGHGCVDAEAAVRRAIELAGSNAQVLS
jgi:subtilisin family serine protease